MFLPFSGCPGRCIYCSQTAVTATPARGPEAILADLDHGLRQALENGTSPLELGFFGGTFTALPAPWPRRFLDLARRYREEGLVTAVRCSTRPDAVTPELLADLADLGLDMVELGVQTFHGPALAASRRGYDPETAHQACDAVRNSGLGLGIQLLPGLPEHHSQHLATDIAATIQHHPAAVRLYPCVVLRGTPLAETHAAGGYTPWNLDQTTQALADALLQLWQHSIPVIRIGLAPEQDLAEHILAGPWHPALGQLARSQALFQYVAARKMPEHTTLTTPKNYQSDVTGHQGSMQDHYRQIGLHHLLFDDQDTFRLE